jgi:hypothetical protein
VTYCKEMILSFDANGNLGRRHDTLFLVWNARLARGTTKKTEVGPILKHIASEQ